MGSPLFVGILELQKCMKIENWKMDRQN